MDYVWVRYPGPTSTGHPLITCQRLVSTRWVEFPDAAKAPMGSIWIWPKKSCGSTSRWAPDRLPWPYGPLVGERYMSQNGCHHLPQGNRGEQ